MKTYLAIWFSTDGKKTSQISERLFSMGFKPTQGNYDFVYEWKRKPSIDAILALADQVHETLKDSGVYFKMETI
ncbi:MAG: hypothetical protein QW735_02070 [archaeon]